MRENHYDVDFLIKILPLFFLFLISLSPPSLSLSFSLWLSPPFTLFLLHLYLYSPLPLPLFASFYILPTSDNVDREALGDLFNQYDSNKSGSITLDELETMLSHLGVGKSSLTVNLWIIQRFRNPRTIQIGALTVC